MKKGIKLLRMYSKNGSIVSSAARTQKRFHGEKQLIATTHAYKKKAIEPKYPVGSPRPRSSDPAQR